MPLKDPEARKAYLREYSRQWYARRRAAFFEGKSCARCGSVEQLELDHIDPATKVSHKIWSWSEVRRLEEIAKCQVLCKLCHEVKTRTEDFPDHGHGRQGYARGCRCDICTADHAVKMREYRDRRSKRL